MKDTLAGTFMGEIAKYCRWDKTLFQSFHAC
jgi:hypothetical protein